MLNSFHFCFNGLLDSSCYVNLLPNPGPYKVAYMHYRPYSHLLGFTQLQAIQEFRQFRELGNLGIFIEVFCVLNVSVLDMIVNCVNIFWEVKCIFWYSEVNLSLKKMCTSGAAYSGEPQCVLRGSSSLCTLLSPKSQECE